MNKNMSKCPHFHLNIGIEGRCDIPLNMFYISPNFDPNAMKLAKLLKDKGFHEERPFFRYCAVFVGCDMSIKWKKMQIIGNTPDETKILEVNFDNSTDQLGKLFSSNVWDSRYGKVFGERLIDNMMDKMLTIISE